MLRSYCLLFALFFAVVCHAQVIPDSIQRKTIRHVQNFPQEKIYLHLDRPHYAPGDTLWFKAYLVEAVTHQRDSVSKNIYVEILRKDNGKRVYKLLLENKGSFTHGNILLHDTLSVGVYEIRAFTNWMRNFPDELFFHKEIYVRSIHDLKQQSQDEQSILQVADLQFFPEGGNLIAGMQNRVAFKGVNQFGKGVDFAAFILSSRNDTVATIQSKHLGMGSFIFQPKAGEKYFAAGKATAGQLQKLYPLPEAQANGYTFFVDNLSSKDKIKIIARNNYGVKDRPILLVHCRGNVLHSIQSVSEGNSFSWNLLKNEIPDDGIIQLTLFNSNGTPLCERLVYNDTKSPMALTISTDKQTYGPREKVTLQLNAKDSEGNGVQGNFSLAVTDQHQVNHEKNGENIKSYFYLSSDVQTLSSTELKGTIEQPGYYFDPANTNASVYLDILLMTQGWRRFTWKEVLNPSAVTKPPFEIETGLTVHGLVKLIGGKKIKQPLNITMMYSPEKDAKEVVTAKTDPDGRFTFANIYVKEPTNGFIQGTKDNGNKSTSTEISIEQFKWPVYKPTEDVVDPFYADVEQMKMLIERQKHYAEMEAELKANKTKVLKEVVVTAKQEKQYDSRKIMYEGTNATTVQVKKESCVSAFHVLQLLQGRVAGLTVTSTGTSGYRASIRAPQSFTGSSAPTYLVDGMVTDAQFLDAIQPCSVESIDVITHPVSMYNALGLVSILTKGGNPNYNWSQDESGGTVVVPIKGYDLVKEFYSPKYSSTDLGQKHISDFRSTIYWNPEVKTDTQGNATVVFWNSDEQTSVRVSVEGISSEATPAAMTYEYHVN